jgi:SAM-dependent methyltransferase
MEMSAEQIESVYHRRFDRELAYRNRVWAILTRWFERFVPPAGAVLDLGCGYGQFINNCRAARRFAMDLNPAARERVSAEVAFFEQDCAAPWPLPEATLDAVFTSNFLEHLPSKTAIAETLSHAFGCLKPGGRLVAMGPNIKYAPGEYWDFWDHHIPLTDRSLIEVLELAGYEPKFVIDRFLPFTMANRRPLPSFFLKAYLQLPFLWRIFGRQFLVVASKPPADRSVVGRKQPPDPHSLT